VYSEYQNNNHPDLYHSYSSSSYSAPCGALFPKSSSYGNYVHDPKFVHFPNRNCG